MYTNWDLRKRIYFSLELTYFVEKWFIFMLMQPNKTL